MNFFIKQFIQDKKSNMSFEHFYVACLEGDYPMVEQLYNGFSLAEKSRAIVCAIVRGHWGSVDWIFLANKPSAERLLQYLYTCCADGKLIELKQLINSKYSFIFKVAANVQQAFRYACFNKQMHVVQWLLSSLSPPNGILTVCFSFRHACFYGSLEIAQWLFSESPLLCASENPEWIDLIFAEVCQQGHLDVAKWLYSLKPDLNISIMDDWAFRDACVRNHVNVVSWLFLVKPDIDFLKFEFLFLLCWEKTQIQMLCVLFFFKPLHHKFTEINVDNEMIMMNWYIAICVELRWKRRKYALWMRSGLIGETNVFYRVSPDVSRYIIQSFLFKAHK